MKVLYFAGAILFMCIAHWIRVLRWELLIDVYEKPDRKLLLQAISVGYILNYFLPFKLGELARAWLPGRKMKNGRVLGFSTVIVDRYLDIVSVGIIFVILSFSGVDGVASRRIAAFYAMAAIVLLFIALLIWAMRSIAKRAIVSFASIFNDRIESVLLQFAWALIWNFKDIFKKISKRRMIVTTISMWCCYLVSYYLFSAFLQTIGVGTKWTDVFMMLFAQNGISGSTGSTTLFGNKAVVAHPVYMGLYMILPILILLAASFLQKSTDVSLEKDSYLRLLPHMDPKERLGFLEAYFSNPNRDYVINYLKINQGVSIIRDYSAGSNATTMLCLDGGGTFFRKYAFGKDGDKLYQQILWIEQNRSRLAVPRILRQEKTEVYCYYDMPYNSNSVGLFEYAHSMPVDHSWKMIQRVLESLEHSIYRINVRKADAETIRRYVETKVTRNIDRIKCSRRISALYQYDTVFINGVEYRNLSFYEKYLCEQNLQKIFAADTYAAIHGDLTIENIICTRDEKGNDDFYIIDPNTGNIHDSPNLDYGKLLQSIHGGYEFLMAAKEVSVDGNRINFLFTRSAAYTELYRLLENYMRQNFDRDRVKSIYFHEIVHWIRLMPYKIEKDDRRALLFYAGMLIVMNDVINMYSSG